ncbi:ATP-dependent transcriptional regulator [Pseudomonas sp. GM78]|uniref:LuxR C-terminal-related transcriptional regulator n=1 Tax=Pseudomonas sp. GM78 TaxID=1144337 RepID=UPI0002707A59|nr:LuxR C-terminal-related transcriptional regulator [Pseudomonas sp. GM78]EJN27575.1 ATP-dependent transcriptional regulator [Pseudomonas sp. GM78]
MNTHLVQTTTRFAPPRIGSQAVSREQLLARLQRDRQSRLQLVTGSAGFGKTTLMAQWRQQLIKNGAQVAWLSVSPDDCRLEAFCGSLLGALRQAGLPLDGDLLLLAGPEAISTQAMASLLINALARMSGELYLMLDDFQQAADVRIAQLMQALIDDAPHHLHVVLASRSTPPLLLGRLRAMGELCEVDCAGLSFNFAESLAFLKAHLDQSVDLDAAHAIHDLTDGWPIGLQLMSIALKANPKKAVKRTALLPDSAALKAYLSEDVVADLPTELFDFLQKISILRRFNVDVAAHVTGSAQAAQLIAAVEERNLFIQPVDLPGNRQWYRLHPLFVEFLTQRLQASGADIAQLHQRAAIWFEQAGLVPEALRHGLHCNDFTVVVQLLERVQPSYRSVSHLSQFMRWLEQVPLAELTRHPSLMLLGIWGAVLTVLTSKARAWISAFESVPQAPQWTDQLQLLKASLAMHGDDETTCLALLGSLADQFASHPFMEQVRVGMMITCLGLAGHHNEVRSLFNGTAGRCLRNSNDEMALMGMAAMTSAALLEGKVLEAERMGSKVLAQAQSLHGRRSVSACGSAAIMAEIFYELDRLDEAREVLANRLDILRFSAPGYMIGAALCHARLLDLQDSPRSALEYLVHKEQHFRALGLDRGTARMIDEQLRITLKCGDWRHAETLQVLLDDLARNHRGASSCDAEVMTLAALSKARLALARRQPEAALQALDIVDRFASELARVQWRVKVELLRAFALDELERSDEALESLRSAVASGYRLGLVRTFLDEGQAFHDLLPRLELKGDADFRVYHEKLGLPASKPSTGDSRETSTVAKEAMREQVALTRREQDIIDLLEQSMSNKRIALALNLSLQTVKWNLKNIFFKFGVSSRYDAIVVARSRREVRAS